MSSSAKRIWLGLGIVYLVWGSTYLAIRVADESIPPFLMAAARFLMAGVALFAWSFRRGDSGADPLGPRQWLSTALVGGLLLLGGNGMVVWAEQRVASGVTALIIATVPIWMAILSAWSAGRRVRWRVVAGLALGFGGTALLIRVAGTGGGTISTPGVVALIGAAISWALGSVLSQRVPLPKRPLVSTAMEMLCGGALLGILALVSGEATRFHPGRVTLASLSAFLYLVVFGSLVAFTAYVWLLQNTTTSLVSTYAYVNPVIAVFLGWVILGERVTGLTLLAAALIVGAVALIVLGQGREPESAARGRRGATLPAPRSSTARARQGSPADAPAIAEQAG